MNGANLNKMKVGEMRNRGRQLGDELTEGNLQ